MKRNAVTTAPMSSLRPAALGVALAIAFLACGCDREGTSGRASEQRSGSNPGPGSPGAKAATKEISGPYVHGNLAVYLVHGPDRLSGKKLIPLDAALRGKKVLVHETEAVNRLAIENVSADAVFIQAGDIVKGGRQDRAIAVDLVVPPHSGKTAIDAFCVEHGRWTRRGAEPVERFSGSSDYLATKELKLAARQRKRQHDVWAAVGAAQEKLRERAGSAAVDPRSSTSMQLTMESAAVKTGVEPYLDALERTPDDQRDAIGCVFAVNGRLSSGDVYASPDLFHDLWPKLLRAGAVEAVAESNGATQAFPQMDAVQAFLADPPSAKRVEEEVGGRTEMITIDGHDTVLFESRDLERRDVWLRRNVVTKDPTQRNQGES